MQPIWQVLAAAKADVVLSGHDHDYERFAPLDAAGAPSGSGIRSFVVGAGGKDLYDFGAPVRGSEFRTNRVHGILELTARAAAYSWRFVAVGGRALDSGSGSCH